MAATLMPSPFQTLEDANGNPISAGRLFVYLAGTTTKTTTYSDAAATSPNTNPVVADSAGRIVVFLPSGITYKFVYALAGSDDPPASPYKTVDNVSAIPQSATNVDIDSQTAGETLLAGDVVALSDGSGGKTAGQWYKADADFTYLSTVAPLIGMAPTGITSGASGSIRIYGRITGLSALTQGTLYYVSATAGALTSTAPANAKPVAVADSTTSVIFQPPTPYATGTIPGIVSTAAQTFAGAKTFTGLAAFSASATFVNSPLFAPGSIALGTMDSTVSGGFYKNTTTNNSSTGGVINLTGDVTIAANTLSANGKTIRFTALLHTAANVNNKQITVSYGGTTIFDSGVFTGGGGRLNIKIVVEIVRTGSATQLVDTVYTFGAVPTGGQTILHDSQTPAKDNTAAQIFKISSATAVANNDIVFDACYGETIG